MIFNKKQKEQRDRIITYKRVFGTPEGKTVLFDLMDRFNILNEHKGDALEMAKLEGKRAAILYILTNCNMNMAEFDKALKGENDSIG